MEHSGPENAKSCEPEGPQDLTDRLSHFEGAAVKGGHGRAAEAVRRIGRDQADIAFAMAIPREEKARVSYREESCRCSFATRPTVATTGPRANGHAGAFGRPIARRPAPSGHQVPGFRSPTLKRSGPLPR